MRFQNNSTPILIESPIRDDIHSDAQLLKAIRLMSLVLMMPGWFVVAIFYVMAPELSVPRPLLLTITFAGSVWVLVRSSLDLVLWSDIYLTEQELHLYFSQDWEISIPREQLSRSKIMTKGINLKLFTWSEAANKMKTERVYIIQTNSLSILHRIAGLVMGQGFRGVFAVTQYHKNPEGLIQFLTAEGNSVLQNSHD